MTDLRYLVNDNKQRHSRAWVMRAVSHLGGACADLAGGGESAAQMVRAGAKRVVAAETRSFLWDALQLRADAMGWELFRNNITALRGQFMVINLDTEHGPTKAADLAFAVMRSLDPRGIMFVTVMGSNRHERYTAEMVAAQLFARTGLVIACMSVYEANNGWTNYTVGLVHPRSRNDRYYFPLAVIGRQVAQRGYYYDRGSGYSYLRPPKAESRKVGDRARAGVVDANRVCKNEACRKPISRWDHARKLFCSPACTNAWHKANRTATGASRLEQRARRGWVVVDRPCGNPECSEVIPAIERASKRYHSRYCYSRTKYLRETGRLVQNG